MSHWSSLYGTNSSAYGVTLQSTTLISHMKYQIPLECLVAAQTIIDTSLQSDSAENPNLTDATRTMPLMPFGGRRTSAFEKMSDKTSSNGITYTSSSNAFTHLQATTIRLPPHEKDGNGTQYYEDNEDEDDGFFLVIPGQRDNIELPPTLNNVKGRTLPSSISPKPRQTSETQFSTIKPRFSLQPRLTRQPLFE